MLFIYLYHGDLYSDMWKSNLYFRPTSIHPRRLPSNMGLTLKSMGLHLKNFMKIKTPRPKNSILFYSTPKGILSFYDLPLKNSMVLQLGDGGELQYPLIP